MQIFEKPDWVSEPKKMDFKVINEPLEAIYTDLLNKLSSSQDDLYFVFHLSLLSARNTYKAIRKLVANDPKYPFQAHNLLRNMIDLLFNIVALIDNPGSNIERFMKADYRHKWEIYQQEYKEYHSDDKWGDWLKNKEKFLDETSKRLKLSEDEKVNPQKQLAYWLTPSQMIKSKFFSSDANKDFLRHIYDWHYSMLSEWHHMTFEGLSMNAFAAKPEFHWIPGKYESDAVYGGMLFSLMLLSEINIYCKYNNIQKLRYIWAFLNNLTDEAKEYYTLRYDSLLQD